MTVIETDSRSRAVIAGHPNQQFIVQENADGSILLQPARTITDAQHEFDTTPALQELLRRASSSGTVRRTRTRVTL